MRELLERFRYRFELWCCQRNDDYLANLHRDPLDERDYSSQADAERALLLRESGVRSAGRRFLVYFGGIALVAEIFVLVARIYPAARFILGIVYLFFVASWTLGMLGTSVRLNKARREYREKQTKSAN